MSQQSLRVDLEGEYPSNAVVTMQPTAQRVASTAAVGWTKRRRYAIANLTDEPLFNHPRAIDLGVTTTLVSGGKALASGNDVRVWSNGVEIARTLEDWNDATYSTLVWIIIPFLAPGASQTYEVVYGNASAGTPPTLTAGLDEPVFDIRSGRTVDRSTNTKWRSRVQEVSGDAGYGIHYLSSGTLQPAVNTMLPGSWDAAITLQNEDDREQLPYTAFEATGTKYVAKFDARRARSGSLTMRAGMGGDGASIRTPQKIVSLRCDFLWTNESTLEAGSTPIGKLVILARNAQGEQWISAFEIATLQSTEATIATATYTLPGGNYKEIAVAVHPNNGIVIEPTAGNDRSIHARFGTICEVNLDATTITQTTIEAEVEIVEVAHDVWTGGGANKVGPRTGVRVGNAAAASGRGSVHTAVSGSSATWQQVKVDGVKRTVEIWNSAGSAKVEDVAIAAVDPYDVVMRGDVAVEQPAVDWLCMTPVVNPLPNPDFAVDASGWIYGSATAGIVTAAISRVAAAGPDGDTGYGLAEVASSSAGANATLEVLASEYLYVGGRPSIWVALALYSLATTANARPAIWFYQEDLTFLSRSDPGVYTAQPATTWERRFYAALVPAGAVLFRVGFVIEEESAAGVVDMRFDAVSPNGPEIAVDSPATVALALSLRVIARFAYA